MGKRKFYTLPAWDWATNTPKYCTRKIQISKTGNLKNKKKLTNAINRCADYYHADEEYGLEQARWLKYTFLPRALTGRATKTDWNNAITQLRLRDFTDSHVAWNRHCQMKEEENHLRRYFLYKKGLVCATMYDEERKKFKRVVIPYSDSGHYPDERLIVQGWDGYFRDLIAQY